MTTKQQRENCGKLADFLEQKFSGSDNFQMHNWVYQPTDAKSLSKWERGGVSSNECGTVCCALGWAAMSGQFEDQGLSYAVRGFLDLHKPLTDEDYVIARTTHEETQLLRNGYTPEATVDGKIVEWADAGIKLFGEHATANIFYHGGILGREAVRRLREVAAGEDIDYDEDDEEYDEGYNNDD